MRRALLVALVALASCSVASPAEQLESAVARMEGLPGVHFEMRGGVRADSPYPEQQPAGGSVRQDVRAWGDIAFPDRIHVYALVGPEGEPPRELIVVGDRVWANIGGGWRRGARASGQTDPRAALAVLKGPGAVTHAGFGLHGGTLTHHLRIVLDERAMADRARRLGDALAQQLSGRGQLDVYVGVFDGRIYRQEVEILEHSDDELAFGSGVFRIRTAFAIDYSNFGVAQEILPPAGD